MEREIPSEDNIDGPLLVRPIIIIEDDDDDTNGWSEKHTGAGDPPPTPLVVIFSTFIAVCGSFATGYATGYSSPAESGIREDLGLSLAAYSVFGSIITVGGVIGALINGRVTDMIGRRGTMWLSQAFCTAGWLSIAFAKNAWWLDVGRLLIGFSVGIICYVVPVYVAEITSSNVRGAFTASSQFMVCCGFSFAYLLGTIISWRILALIGCVSCVVQIIGLFFIPESPRWLVNVNRQKEFEATLQWLRGKNTDISEEAANIRDHTETETFERQSNSSTTTFLDLFQQRYAHSLVIGVGLMLLQQFSGTNAMAYYATSIFEAANFSGNFGTRAMAIIQVPVTGLSVILMDRVGRRPLLMMSSGGMCISGLLLVFSFFMQDRNYLQDATPILVFIAIMAYSFSYSLGMGGLPWLLMSEIFPINVKGSAGSLVSLVSWSSSWVVTYTFNFIFEWCSPGSFFIFAVISALTVVFTAKVIPETKGRTLEEIQASLTTTTTLLL